MRSGAARAASLRRSVELFQGFRREQSDPDYFYALLAADSVQQLSGYVDLPGRVVLDVGGGAGYFADAFRGAGAAYFGIDPDVGELTARGEADGGMLRASGTELPIRTGSVDVCYSSNVLEHVREPERMMAEMARVTKPGGIVFVSFTPWLSPWGGHETSPWHFLGGDYARRRYRRRMGKEPKNVFGESLFAARAGAAIRWARRSAIVDVVHILPRYHPWWAQWIALVPGAREILSWNVVLVLRRRAVEADGA
ncbi:SAM-dependent methyltransferase [Allocatelliglobosispora scoriae]|uniref:SAM-dependent methyltransferase n=1 Tax=Allocatelliglobosispora scoriae TaxID=643052 RepID=A0A841BNI1_9ACTN|nr:class I SAM-dependent methyltransferase [Allocatelliglobosispora scoriae]MBB5869824.1 SAM-dependent methyltransferase [Allocatelliglobosispora scoriae]